MKTCLSKKKMTQQEKMKSCNATAGDKKGAAGGDKKAAAAGDKKAGGEKKAEKK